MRYMLEVAFLCLFINLVQGQSKADEIVVESWKKGTDTIVEQKFCLRVSTKNRSFSKSVFSTRGTEYHLKFVYVAPVISKDYESGSTTESWAVELQPVSALKSNLGYNLLKAEGIGGGGDNFPREDLVGYLYPKTSSGSKINGIPLIDGRLYYPIFAPRVVKINDFLVRIQVLDYQLNQLNFHLVDFMDISVELQNKGRKK